MTNTATWSAPTKDCDVIMKGGITSGIVYPKAILTIARDHRFRSIGGTSAGAIAASITAAAEYGRASGGFDVIARIPDEMRINLASLFQPTPEARTLFRLLQEGVFQRRWLGAILAALTEQWIAFLLGAGIGLLTTVLAYALGAGWAAVIPGFVLAILLGVVAAAAALARRILLSLPRLDYGLCPGRTQEGQSKPALSDWLAITIEQAAGRMIDGKLPERPLTFGDLWSGGPGAKPGNEQDPAIDLKMMTTNLSMQRPSVLPDLGDKNYLFSPDELRAIFPDWIVDYLVAATPAEGDGSLRQFPLPADLPVVVAARMSLSFPFLISAVPVYRKNFRSIATDTEISRVLFSDGGISSNFPIHFFDSLLPRRPTFAISLDSLDPKRPERRVRLPMPAREGRWLEVNQINGVGDFAMSILSSARNWQDHLQSTLPGYRERIVHVHLDDDREGGYNLTMTPEVIDTLVELGQRAGTLLVGETGHPDDRTPFDFSDHRWRRFLVAFARLEETLCRAATTWGRPGEEGRFGTFIENYQKQPGSYDKSSPEWRTRVFERFDSLMRLATPWCDDRLGVVPDAIPRPPTDIRITPRP